MILFISEAEMKRNILYNIIAAVFLALFGAVYEHFSHEVYSYYMIYAFAIPLVLGALVYTVMLIGKKYPAKAFVTVWNAAIAALGIGCVFRGVLEIYGTTNSLTVVYPIVGGALLLAGLLLKPAKKIISRFKSSFNIGGYNVDNKTKERRTDYMENNEVLDNIPIEQETQTKKTFKPTVGLLITVVSIMLVAAIAVTALVTSLTSSKDGSSPDISGGVKAAAISADYDEKDATGFVFSDSGITAKDGAYSGYEIEGTSLKITQSGTYIVSGSCSNGTITIKKEVAGVTLVLNGLDLTASATAPITCGKQSEVSIVAAAGSVNNLADDKFNNDDIYTDTNLYPDIENAVIKCKDGSNVTICGTGTINITSNGKNGIKGGADRYEEDANGNATDKLISQSALNIGEVTLNVTANTGDGIKSDKELGILSGNITVVAADDGIKSDYTLNIGAENTDGPTINVEKSKEGIEAATLNIYSGDVKVNATDDGINAANSDLGRYSFAYNQYGGNVYVNVTNGDGVDSNGTINLMGGTLEVVAPSQGDGDPLDSEGGTNFKGTTVLAVGHLGMAQGYSAETSYVTFGSSFGGFGGMGGNQAALVGTGSTIEITDAAGKTLYSAKAVRDASYILFASSDLTSGSTYTLKCDGKEAATATAGTQSTSGMGGGMGGRQGGFGGQGQTPDNGQGNFGGGNGQQQTPPDGSTPPEIPQGGQQQTPPDGSTPPEMPGGGQHRGRRGNRTQG
ncbi:MAG: carbohydrate-binding domain-containing protein [Clostridia bacterium]|nr:carbohydrate-binding domain-containing protein [Clostridia bacterium]